MARFPQAPKIGQAFLDVQEGKLYVWQGYAWDLVPTGTSGSGGGTSGTSGISGTSGSSGSSGTS